MNTHITESTRIHTNPGNPSDPFIGQTILTVTLWADSERIQTFGGMIKQDDNQIRSQAAAAANKWDGTTGAEIRAYDAFVKNLS